MYYEMIGFVSEPQGEGPVETQLPALDLESAALFLDFDGTLVDLAPTPDSIEVPGDLAEMLTKLDARTGGRLVIVTGRPIEVVCGHLGGFDGHVIGSHGAEERIGDSISQHPLAGSDVAARLGDMAEAFAATHEGLLAERKPAGVVLHFRQSPEREADAYAFFHALEQSHEGFELHHSKMAYELRPEGISKDASIRRVMEGADFAGRRPVFFGDDVTDEPALAWVTSQADGVSVKVGHGDTQAAFRVADPAAARAALRAWLENGG